MAWYRCGGGGLPAGLQSDMDTVLNKKLGTSTTYPPTDWPDTVNLMGPLPEKTASGAIANITDGADGVPLKNWLVTLPASLDGYSEVNGVRTGKNLYIPNFTQDGANRVILYDNIYLPVGNYYLSLVKTGTVANFYMRKHGVSAWSNVGGYNKTEISFSISEADSYDFSYYISTGVSASDISDLQLEVGTSKTSYETPQSPTQYTASLGRTIYGGTADIVTGEGSNGSILIDLSELTWNMDNDTRFRSRQTDYTGASGWSGSWQNTVSNRFVCENPSTAFTNRSDYSFANIPQNYYNFDIKVPTGIFANANEFKAWLANIDGNNTHAVVVIDRLTAETFTFTPITPTPETALGVNNFWADEGDSDVTYRADISLALQALGGGGRGLMLMRPTEPEETEETEEMEGLEDELNR